MLRRHHFMDRSHKVDISGLLAAGRQLMLVDDEVELEPFEGISFPGPARVHLELRYVDRSLTVEGTVDVPAHGQCDSCLENVDWSVHVDVDERFDPSAGREIDPFGDSNVLTGDRLDVADLVQQVVLSTLPIVVHCSDNCQGLCGECGVNRNIGACECALNGDLRG
jgi:uncharacterized protein